MNIYEIVKGRGDIVAQNETILITESAKIAIDVDSEEAGVVINTSEQDTEIKY
jgi:biotin carboxyl carrier protein